MAPSTRRVWQSERQVICPRETNGWEGVSAEPGPDVSWGGNVLGRRGVLTFPGNPHRGTKATRQLHGGSARQLLTRNQTAERGAPRTGAYTFPRNLPLIDALRGEPRYGVPLCHRVNRVTVTSGKLARPHGLRIHTNQGNLAINATWTPAHMEGKCKCLKKD